MQLKEERGLSETVSIPLCIAPRTWEHFTSVFAQAPGFDSERDQIEPPQTISWPLVLPDTVSSLIKQMHSSKAPGPDLIPFDLLKTNLPWWSNLLGGPFAQIRNYPGVLKAHNDSSNIQKGP